ncbi:MAG: FAD-dependent oxidoreductase [bacterium]|nr:FAD-dependent oxidoreductase [bacterium]
MKYDYDLIVVGGGAGGFVSAKLANGLGAKTAIIEKNKIGGQCTWYGCIPSKALIKAGQMAHCFRQLDSFGLKPANPLSIDSSGVMAHVRSVVNRVYNSHLPESFGQIGINIFFGTPEFADHHHIKLDGKIFSSKNFIISTGSRAFIPPIEGINEIPYLINDTLFDLEVLPGSMIILGGGPIGIELAQALNRLGVKVTIVEMMDRILFREDKELGGRLSEILKKEGLNLLTGTKAIKFSMKDGKIILTVQNKGKQNTDISADAALIAVGRSPNIEGLSLEKAGIQYTRNGITTDNNLRTTPSNIYACGDVVGPYQFSHIAEYQAVTAVTNMLLPIKKSIDYKNIIWCTYTDPEFAHAGLTEEEARVLYGDKIKIFSVEYNKIDRGKVDLAGEGIAKFICDDKSKLIGAHILGERAGEIIHEAQLAKSLEIPFYKIQSIVHAYPSYSDVLKQSAKLCYIDKLRNNKILKIINSFLGEKK